MAHSRRRSIRIGALIVSAVALVSGCVSDDATSGASGENEPSVATELDSSTGPDNEVDSEVDSDAVTTTEDGPEITAAAVVEATNGCDVGDRNLAAGQSTIEFEAEGRTRSYEIYVPEAYSQTTPMAVVINWHGLGSTGDQQLLFSEYPLLAEREGFLVVAPTGVPSPGDTRNSWELTDVADPTRDDLAFAEALLDHIGTQVCVDETRIYTTGMSNGGYFSSRLVCELSDRIAAASSVAGLTHENDCEPSRAVPYIAFHGVDDEIVPFSGGGFTTLAPGVYLELMDRVIPDEFAEFAVDFGCDVEPVTEPMAGGVVRTEYQGCSDDVEVIFYSLAGAGHTWPGSRQSALISQGAGLGVTNTEVNASELSWEFFSRHQLSD